MRNYIPEHEVTEEWKKAAGLLASRKCKDCYRRGYLKISPGYNKQEQSNVTYRLCYCLRKNK